MFSPQVLRFFKLNRFPGPYSIYTNMGKTENETLAKAEHSSRKLPKRRDDGKNVGILANSATLVKKRIQTSMGRRRKTKDRPKQEPSPGAQGASRGEPAEPASRFSEQIGLKILVFTAGAVLMGLEIAGSRVLAPHYGNSVFVWGSLISVFLIALSAGYFLGGRVADRHPTRMLLNSICVVVSLLIFGIAIFAQGICEAFRMGGFGEQSGPFFVSMVLFLPPSVGMGMVSPFAIRLATPSVKSVGKISGTLYALSTMGSIAGTLLTTFVLIPLLGLSVILKGLGLVLLVTSVLTHPFWRNRQSPAVLAALAVLTMACLLWPGAPRTDLLIGDRLVVDVDTPYHHISVIDNGNARQMRFDRFVESSISLTPPHESLANYTDYFHLALLARPEIQRALFIGAGGGVGPRAFHMHAPEMAIDVVDIDPKVLELARTHFFMQQTPKIRSIAEDGRMFVRQANEKYDCVVLDAFTIGGRIPFHLVTKEFFELCSEKMTPRGVFVMNINSALEGPQARIFRSMYRTIDSVFPNTYVFSRDHGSGGRQQTTNILFVAAKGTDCIRAGAWMAGAKKHQSDSYITSRHMQQMVDDLVVNLPDVSRAPVFTDDYAPIETMPF